MAAEALPVPKLSVVTIFPRTTFVRGRGMGRSEDSVEGDDFSNLLLTNAHRCVRNRFVRFALQAMPKKSKLFIIIFISTAQLALTLLAVAWLFNWTQDETRILANKQINEVNQFASQQLADRIGTMRLNNLNQGSEDWEKLQAVIGNVSLPFDGFVSVVDSHSGHIIAYPGAEVDSHMVGKTWDTSVFSPVRGDMLASLAQSRIGGDSGTQMEFGNSVHLVHSKPIDGLKAFVLSHHRTSGNVAGNSHLLSRLKGFWFAVALVIGLMGTVLNVFVIKRISDEDARLQNDLADVITQRTDELVQIKNAIIFGLAKLAESRDNDTGEHLDRIRKYVTILASDLESVYNEIDHEFIQNLAIASSLHDIGKVGIPDSILLKPGKLTTLERSIMEKHTVIGGECLEAIGTKLGDNDFLEMAREVAYWHHEQWDGNGYPHQLSNEQIPISARIVAVADVYDALTSRRPYKRGMSHTESRAIILSGSGQKFDPEVVAAFLRHELEFQKIARRYQNVESSETATPANSVASQRAQKLIPNSESTTS